MHRRLVSASHRPYLINADQNVADHLQFIRKCSLRDRLMQSPNSVVSAAEHKCGEHVFCRPNGASTKTTEKLNKYYVASFAKFFSFSKKIKFELHTPITPRACFYLKSQNSKRRDREEMLFLHFCYIFIHYIMIIRSIINSLLINGIRDIRRLIGK